MQHDSTFDRHQLAKGDEALQLWQPLDSSLAGPMRTDASDLLKVAAAVGVTAGTPQPQVLAII